MRFFGRHLSTDERRVSRFPQLTGLTPLFLLEGSAHTAHLTWRPHETLGLAEVNSKLQKLQTLSLFWRCLICLNPVFLHMVGRACLAHLSVKHGAEVGAPHAKQLVRINLAARIARLRIMWQVDQWTSTLIAPVPAEPCSCARTLQFEASGNLYYCIYLRYYMEARDVS